MPIEFALLGGDRYKIIIGMDILHDRKMLVDLAQESLKFKLPSEEKVNLKLTPRSAIFKSKQLRAYREYLAGIRRSCPEVAAADEDVSDVQALEASALPLDADDVSYLGKELAHLSALSQLPPQLPDTPHDATRILDKEFAKLSLSHAALPPNW